MESEKNSFAGWLKREREARGLQQQELADLINKDRKFKAANSSMSASLISHYERGADVPSDKALDALLRVLEVTDDRLVYKIKKRVLEERKKREERGQNAPRFHFGETLGEICRAANITSADLASESGRPKSTVDLWISRRKLPSAKSLVNDLLPALERLGVPENDLRKLKAQHFRDVMAGALELDYLTPIQQGDLLKVFARELSKKMAG